MTDRSAYIRAMRGPVLVTGASGFIGANLFKMIAAERSDVYAGVRREPGWRLVGVPHEQLISVDLNDPTATKNLVDTLAPQTVLDCVSYGAYSFEQDPTLIYRTNYQAIVNLTTQLAANPFSAYVHAGSSSEYGTNCSGPREDTQCVPNSHYSVSKVAVGDYLRFVGKNKGFPCVTLRLYSVYGPLEDTSRLIPKLLRKATSGEYPSFVSPETSRDFVHVDDVCEAFVLAAVKMHPGIYGEPFNIGTGTKTTIRDLAELTGKMFNIRVKPEFGNMEARSWDLTEWYANPSKAGELLGWSAKIQLENGLHSTAKWVASLSENQMATSTKKNISSTRRSLSAVIACYKDEEAIPLMYERLTNMFRKLGIDYEIIFVNDCSPDKSAEVVRSLSNNDPHVVGISHSRNFGSQMAFRSGMEISTKDGVVLLDGDLQDPPELIESFFRLWEEGYDVVFGRRVSREMPWYWGVLYKFFYRIFSAFSYINIPHDAGDFSLIDRRVVGWLLRCPERDLFMRGLRAYVGFKQTGVNYVRPNRMFGRSTNNLFKNIDWAKRGIFSFSNTPLTMLTAVGIISLALSITAALTVALLRILFPDIAPRGITSVLIAILIFGSLNLFAVGLVGEYVAKIMMEVKGRPRLIRSALIRHGQVTNLLPDDKSN